jgi:L-threonylcarbamoyladenylate synthase
MPLTRVLDTHRSRPGAIADSVAAVVQRGGSVIFPTDTVYGIGCDPLQPDAVDKIFALKGRPRTKPLSLHIATVAELLEYASGNALAARAAEAFLPGSLTLIVRRPSFVDARVTAGSDTLGLRVPKHDVCRAILERCGPLAGTSANLSGEPAFTGIGSALDLPAADVRVDDGPTALRAESTIVDVSGERPRLVRAGAIALSLLEEALGPIERPRPRSQTGESSL